jgi:N-acetylglucosaminyldiphosphoundecaprenol N-acetyl-beta-D-mannosaminyltransferase
MRPEFTLDPTAGGGAGCGTHVGDAPLATRAVFGYDFVSSTSIEAVAEHLLRPQPDDGRLPLVLTPNVDYLVRLDRPAGRALAGRVRQSRCVLPDGQPIVWASRLNGGGGLAARLPGSSLFPPMWRRIVADGRRAVIVASTEETAERLREEHPEVGVVLGEERRHDDAEALAAVVADCRDQIDKVEPEFVFVGISFPKQQLISLALIDQLRAEGKRCPLFLTLGASFEMYLGMHRRAPSWLQRLGLEWFFRFLLEPRRLFRRYFVTDLRFAVLVGRKLIARRSQARSTEPAAVQD